VNIIKFQEDMVYKNLFYRFIFSFLLLLLYFITSKSSYFLFAVATSVYLIIIYESFTSFKKYLNLIILYLLCSYLCFCIYFIKFFDIYFFNICIISIIIFDSFSYFVGLLFGRNYIFKKISPKKTLEGYFGGFFFTNIILIIYFITMKGNFYILQEIILINSIVLFSVLGDLIQSFFKRNNNIKDSSTYLPGHGGFFDRFDSFISSIIFLLLYSFL